MLGILNALPLGISTKDNCKKYNKPHNQRKDQCKKYGGAAAVFSKTGKGMKFRTDSVDDGFNTRIE